MGIVNARLTLERRPCRIRRCGYGLWSLWLICLAPWALAAKPLAPGDAPDALKPWVGWALHGEDAHVCSIAHDDPGERRCLWPTRLSLQLDANGGRFEAQWRAEAETWAALPGEEALWPQQVELDGTPALVAVREGVPAVRLPPGEHRATGRFAWERLPENLAIPRDSGLLSVAVEGRPVQPAFDAQGRLWIQGAQRPAREEVANTLTARVFRKIADETPLLLVTRLDMEIAGEQREVWFSGALLPEFVPLRLSSPLPARLEPDGRLRVQARPGRWQIELVARHPAEIPRLAALAEAVEPWPAEEVWSFEAHQEIRVVEIEGAPAVDPRQTDMPPDWQNLPAWRIRPGDALEFKPLRRGDPASAPDNLSLRRRLWLDFDGGGYTAHDEIGGSLSRDWRFDALPGVDLGRVDIDGEAQPITRQGEDGPPGVEIRRGQVRLAADSRLERADSRLSATGWARDFQSVSAELNLPPGWRLFAALGVDNAPGAWAENWSLLDFFMTLILALAAGSLRGWGSGVAAGLALALLWHEPDAPRYVWMHLLIAVALLRALPEGRVAVWVRRYRNLSALALLFVALPFMTEQVRVGLYPQLAYPGRETFGALQGIGGALEGGMQANAPAPMQNAEPPEAEAVMAPPPPAPQPEAPGKPVPKRKAPASLLDSDLFKSDPSNDRAEQFRALDPNAITQTGPGLPDWHWRSLTLSWNGPVLADQEIRLLLLPPAANLALNLARVASIVLLAWTLLREGGGRGASGWRVPGFGAVSALVLALLAIPHAKAELPSQALLDELKTRLLAPPDCAPACAQIPTMRLRLGATDLNQRLEVHALAAVAVPLPAQEGQWLPERVEIDGKAADSLFRTPGGALWVGLKPGRHEVSLNGPLPARPQFQLALPLRPHRLEAEGGGWRIEGLRENGEPEAQLQLTRILATGGETAEKELEARPLPPFLEVHRTLILGLNWRVATRVRRVSPADAPVLAEIPLLPGESVLTPGLQAKNGKLALGLAPGQTETAWESALEMRPSIRLEAPRTDAWSEIWRVDLSPAWHLESEGIPVVRHMDERGARLPEWRPWPGETVALKLTRPQGAKGATLTIDESRLILSPGQRAEDAQLSLTLRSAQGGQHTLKLPAGAALQRVAVDGAERPIRQQGQTVTLPIRPGRQTFDLYWREERGIGWRYVAPETDLGAPSVNGAIEVHLGQDRWTLLTGGPRLGPAVLFWGALAVLLPVSFALGRLNWTPLRARHWFLLLIGLSQIDLSEAVGIVGWLFALGWRGRRGEGLSDRRFNWLQAGMAILSPLALLWLFDGVEHGLLGLPDMQIAGNGSDAWRLNWYSDRNAQTLAQPWALSAPLWLYRALMLAWALWLALRLLGWLRWGWSCCSAGGLWRRRKPKPAEAQALPGWTDDGA